MTSSGHPFSPCIKKGEVSLLRSLSFIKSSPCQEIKSSRRHSMKDRKASQCSSDHESCLSKTATHARGPVGDRLAATGTQNPSPVVEFLPRTPTSEKGTLRTPGSQSIRIVVSWIEMSSNSASYHGLHELRRHRRRQNCPPDKETISFKKRSLLFWHF